MKILNIVIWIPIVILAPIILYYIGIWSSLLFREAAEWLAKFLKKMEPDKSYSMRSVPFLRFSLIGLLLILLFLVPTLYFYNKSHGEWNKNLEEQLSETSYVAYEEGYDAGHKDGYDTGWEDGYDSGCSVGYDVGYEDAQSEP